MEGIRITSGALDAPAALRLAEYDTYRRRLAGCTGDNALAVYDRVGGNNQWECGAKWQADTSRVTQVAWAHSEFGQLLAVASDRGDVSVYEETLAADQDADEGPGPVQSTWQLRVQSHDAACSISDLRFGPKQQGLCLAAAYEDGYVRLYTSAEVLSPSTLLLENDFRASTNSAALCLFWRPWTAGVAPALLVGTGEGAAIWAYSAPLNCWQVSAPLVAAEEGPVAAVAWAPTLGRPLELVAAAAGPRVHVFSCQGPVDALQTTEVAVLEHPAPVWKVEWNMLGNWLATSSEDCTVRLWRPDFAGRWGLLHKIVGTQQ